jgi:hypothetical protein
VLHSSVLAKENGQVEKYKHPGAPNITSGMTKSVKKFLEVSSYIFVLQYVFCELSE